MHYVNCLPFNKHKVLSTCAIVHFVDRLLSNKHEVLSTYKLIRTLALKKMNQITLHITAQRRACNHLKM